MLMAHLRALIDSLLVIGGKAYVFPCHSDLYASPLPPSLMSSCDVVCHVCSSPVTSLIDENSSVFIWKHALSAFVKCFVFGAGVSLVC